MQYIPPLKYTNNSPAHKIINPPPQKKNSLFSFEHATTRLSYIETTSVKGK